MNVNSELPGRKEREVALRREAILDAAREIFETEGYVNATMAQIASRAEFGVGTLYQFFPSKQNLFAEVILRGVGQYEKGMTASIAAKASWQDRLKSFIEYHLSWIEENPAFHRLVYEIFYSPIPDLESQIFEAFKDVQRVTIEQLQNIFMDANKAEQRYDPDLMSLMILGAVHVIGDNLFLGILDKHPTDYISGILQVILGGNFSE